MSGQTDVAATGDAARSRWTTRAAGVVTALGPASGLPDVARLTRGWALSVTAGFVCRVAMLVWAFETGGTGLVAAYGVVTTVPGAVVTPVATGLVRTVRADRLLRGLVWGRALPLGAAAAGMALAWSPALVLALVVVASSLSGCYRPIQAASLPWLVHTPAQLSAANVRATVMENSAGLVGPLVGGAVLAVSDPAATLAVSAATMALAAVTLRRLRTPEELAPSTRGLREAGAHIVVGARSLGRVVPRGGIVVMGLAQTVTRGLLLVLTVVVALDVLALQRDSVGWLTAMTGLGGLVGGALAGRVLRVTRLARCFVLGIALWGLPLVVLAVWPTTVTAFGALFVVGVGNALEDGALFTLVPRVVGVRHAPAALGALEIVAFGGAGLGSLAAPALSRAIGAMPVLLVAGSLLVLLAAGYASRCLRIDAAMPEPGPDLALLHGFPVFQPLPLVTVEQLLAATVRHRYVEGEPVVVEGDPGDAFHLIASGEASVTVGGAPRPMLHRGDGFGEIALLRDVPRTATVVAAGRLETLAVDRADFLAAVGGNSSSAEYAELLATTRLSRDEERGRS